MDSIIEFVIINCLSSVGYTRFSKRAIEHFKQAFINNYSSFLNSLSAVTLHAQRSKSNFIDVNNTLKLKNKTITYEDRTCNVGYNELMSYVEFEEEERQEIVNFENPIASNIDRFIHVYEFMPHFPPSHTFKRNYTKEIGKYRRPDGIKKKIEETVLVERSLIRIMKERRELKPYANYLMKK
ncbi:hypothetical protein BDAP_001371 [Binucleata daphniae]